MSTFEEIFLSTGGENPGHVAAQLAAALGMEITHDTPGRLYVGRTLPDEPDTRIGGEVHTNPYPDPDPLPDEVSVLDGYDIVYAVWCTNPVIQQAEASRIFDQITGNLPWPALLTHNANLLHAAWHPETGRRNFDPPISPDVEDRHAWAEYQRTTPDPEQ